MEMGRFRYRQVGGVGSGSNHAPWMLYRLQRDASPFERELTVKALVFQIQVHLQEYA